MDEALRHFLEQHPSFGGWEESWLDVPLRFRVCLTDELPPRAFVGSVRALILHGDEVLLVHSSVPILNVGGRCQPNESIVETLHREVGEETGWRVEPIGVIGFTHVQHLDEQRPDWGRPAPDFIDPMFAVEAQSFDANILEAGEAKCEFVPINTLEHMGMNTINMTFLKRALTARSQSSHR